MTKLHTKPKYLSNGTYVDTNSIVGVLGETIAIGQPCFQDVIDGKWYLAKAIDGMITNLSVCLSGGVADEVGSFGKYNVLSGLTGLPDTSSLYLSQITAGELVAIKPGSGMIIYIGISQGTTDMIVDVVIGGNSNTDKELIQIFKNY